MAAVRSSAVAAAWPVAPVAADVEVPVAADAAALSPSDAVRVRAATAAPSCAGRRRAERDMDDPFVVRNPGVWTACDCNACRPLQQDIIGALARRRVAQSASLKPS